MIKDIKDLQGMLLKEAERYTDPLFRDIFMMDNKGCAEDRINYLRKLIPELPESYTTWLSRLNLNGVCIGYFMVSPFSKHPVDIVESFIESYEDPFFPKEFMEKHHLYQIGTYNTDLICLSAGSARYEAGEILFIEEGEDIYNPQDSQIHKIARNFEQFLLAAGNMYKLRQEIYDDDSNLEIKQKEFMDCLKELRIGKESEEFWLSLF